MLSTSLEFRRKVAQNTKTVHKATLTLADSTVVELVGKDLMDGTSFTESVSSQSSFDIGAAVIGRHDFILRNDTGKFDEYDFTGATVIPYVGIELDDGTTEWLRKGIFGIEQPNSYGNTIALSSLDNMRFFETPYSDVATSYPATLATIASDICAACGVSLYSVEFANSGVSIPARPDDDALTCLDMVAFVAQASGNWAKCDTYGRLVFDWYDTSILDGVTIDWLDGGTFDTTTTPYSDGDDADGGGFHYDVDSHDGGDFATIPYVHLFAFSSLSVATDDVVITGVRVTAQDERRDDDTSGASGETVLYGAEGYVLEIADNPLIQYGTAQAAASRIGLRVVGMRFRPFDASVIGDPAVEAGDVAILTDAKQRQYQSYITSSTWRAGSFQSLSCGAETPSRNSATSYSAMTKATVQMRNAFRAEKTARETAAETLALMLASASGLYKTESVQDDGSVIYYLHDKATLGASSTVWKATADAFGVSTDGGETYSYGVDSNGVAILNQIYAVGINADYIDAGALTVRDTDNNIIFRASVEDHFTNIGGLYASNGLLYNESLGLSGAGLYFYYTDTDTSTKYTVGGLWPGKLTDSETGNMVGQLELFVPTQFNVRSFHPYDSSDNGVYLFRYNRDDGIMYVGRSGEALSVEFSTSANIYYGNYENAKLYNSTIYSGCNIADFTVTGDGFRWYNRQSLWENNRGSYISKDGIAFTYGWTDSATGENWLYAGMHGMGIRGGYGDEVNGYVSFYPNLTRSGSSTKLLGTKVGGEDIVVIAAPTFAVMDFTTEASGTTWYSGKTGTVTVVTGFTSSTNYTTKTLTFTKGLITGGLS